MSAKIHKCDCDKPADKRDGSGWSCPDCRIKNAAATDMIDTQVGRRFRETELTFTGERKREWFRNYHFQRRKQHG